MEISVKQNRNQRLEARISKAQKQMLERAAAIRGMTLTGFVVSAAEQAAQQVIEREQVIQLSNEDQIIFFNALENPPKPNKAVKEAVAMYREIVDDKG